MTDVEIKAKTKIYGKVIPINCMCGKIRAIHLTGKKEYTFNCTCGTVFHITVPLEVQS